MVSLGTDLCGMGLWLQDLKLISEITRSRGFWGKQLVRGPMFLISPTSTLANPQHVPTQYMTEALPNQQSQRLGGHSEREKKTPLPDMLDCFQRGYALRTQASQLSPLPPHSLSPLGWEAERTECERHYELTLWLLSVLIYKTWSVEIGTLSTEHQRFEPRTHPAIPV